MGMNDLLKYFIVKCCLLESYNLEDCAKVLPSIGEQIKILDPTEDHFHVEQVHDKLLNENLTLVYRSRDWKNTVARRENQKKQAEQERIASQLAKEQEELVAKERSICVLQATNKLRVAGKTDKEITAILDQCFKGDLPNLAAKLNLEKFCIKKESNLIENLKSAFED